MLKEIGYRGEGEGTRDICPKGLGLPLGGEETDVAYKQMAVYKVMGGTLC